jgi:hypothetical protein
VSSTSRAVAPSSRATARHLGVWGLTLDLRGSAGRCRVYACAVDRQASLSSDQLSVGVYLLAADGKDEQTPHHEDERFKGAIGTVSEVSLPERRAETLAGLYLAANLGLAGP